MYVPIRATVDAVIDLSPHFRRIVFTGPDVDSLMVDYPIYDQRIKLIVPPPSGQLPILGSDPEWYREWLALPEDQRGSMRTYSIRSLTRRSDGLHLAVDVVMHGDVCGPAGEWAATARPGDELLIVIPSQGPASGGIEFDPAGARDVILLGDETAAPAIARILEDLADERTSLSGRAFIEVPTSEDRLTIEGPSTIDVRWLPRDGAPRGALLGPALGWHMTTHEPATSDELIWETPTHSASGAPTPGPSATSEAWPYCWIAGESSVVTGLRRHLVRDVGIDRRRVAFMGYWREGVAMRG